MESFWEVDVQFLYTIVTFLAAKQAVVPSAKQEPNKAKKFSGGSGSGLPGAVFSAACNLAEKAFSTKSAPV